MFKVGDRVKPKAEHAAWINGHWAKHWLTRVGASDGTYYVTSVLDEWGNDDLKISTNAGGDGPFWYADKFELAPAKTQFKVGDRVRYNDKTPKDYWMKPGYVGVVQTVRANDYIVRVYNNDFKMELDVLGRDDYLGAAPVVTNTPVYGDRVRFERDGVVGFGRYVYDAYNNAVVLDYPIKGVEGTIIGILPTDKVEKTTVEKWTPKFKIGDRVSYTYKEKKIFGKVVGFGGYEGDKWPPATLHESKAVWTIDERGPYRGLVLWLEESEFTLVPPFAVGDYIRFKDDHHKGRIGKIDKITAGNWAPYRIALITGSMFSTGGDIAYAAADEIAAADAPKFKTGDRVDITAGWNKGKTGLVKNVIGGSYGYRYTIGLNEWSEPVLDEDVLEPSKKPAWDPKFKVGQRVYYDDSCTGERAYGRVKAFGKAGQRDGQTSRDPHPVWCDWEKNGYGWMPEERLSLADNDNDQTFIVALRENGVLKPAANPHRHTTRASADVEADRLSRVHQGKEFVVLEQRGVALQVAA